MKLLLACLLVFTVSASQLGEERAQFQAFKVKHGKTYKTHVEEIKRFNIFKDNLRSIEEHNELYKHGLTSYTKAINQFADMTQQEFEAMLTLSSSNKPHLNATKHVKTGFSIPDSVDWRAEGLVTEVKDQASCGSCWAFSLTGSTEGAYKLSSGNLVSLSEQQLVDCSTDINDGCSGGYLDATFPYLEDNGLQTEDSYPYTGVDGDCKYSADNVVTKISGYKSITAGDEDALLDAVANVGPVSVAMDATFLAFYGTGIVEDQYCSRLRLNHGVLVVGYGTEDGYPFWIVKNSWGTTFGENGFFRIIRGENDCGIAEDACYPII